MSPSSTKKEYARPYWGHWPSFSSRPLASHSSNSWDDQIMTLEQLRIFAAVAEKQHVTQAARELNLTQSASSAAIAALEERYGVKLFDRVGRGIILTHG